MGDRVDDQLFEGLLLEEIELLNEVITAAAMRPEPLTSAQVDEVLEVARLRGPGQTRRDVTEPAAKPSRGARAQGVWNRENVRAWRTSMDMED